jgi:adenylate cyclase class IV
VHWGNDAIALTVRALRPDLRIMQSVEWKAEVRVASMVRALVRRLGALRVGEVVHTDTYFRVVDGTLLRRETDDEEAGLEYIHYLRPPEVRPRRTRFTLYSEEQALERFGVRPLPVWVVVEKRREIWVHDGVRVHLDDVTDLGRFVELEALVTQGRSIASCEEKIARLRALIAPFVGEPVARGYAELLALELETSDDPA